MVNLNIRDTSLPKNVLYCDSDIGELKNRPEGSVTEEELKGVLRRYNLRDSLILLGKLSTFILNDKSKNRLGKTAFRDPETGIFVTQFALAYLASALISSGSNDYKSKQLNNKQNLLALCNIYSNCLVFPEIKRDESVPFGKKNFISSLVRMHGEQFEYQYNHVNLIARTIVIFTEVIFLAEPKKFAPLDSIFKEKTGLTFYEYFVLAIASWSASQQTATLRKEIFIESQIPSMQAILTEKKVTNYFNMLSTDYETFRNEDKRVNADLDPIFTKYRFNPLFVYPIIKTQKKSTDAYVIPNTLCYLRATFGGLYWWFHLHFEKLGKQMDFRAYYGEVFEKYVGMILKHGYGEHNVHSEIKYARDKMFIDWWVKRDSKIYLFEAKAYQFSLRTKQTADIELLIQEIRKKIAQSMKQVYERIQDINKYPELSMFKDQNLVPIIVFMEIPLISGHFYKELVDDEVERLEKSGLYGIKDMRFHFLNIEELELYSSAVDKIPLEEVFIKCEDNMSESFVSILTKETGETLRNQYLDKIYTDFWSQMLGTEMPPMNGKKP